MPYASNRSNTLVLFHQQSLCSSSGQTTAKVPAPYRFQHRTSVAVTNYINELFILRETESMFYELIYTPRFANRTE